MDQISIHLTEGIPGYDNPIHRPPSEVKFEPYGVVVQWVEYEVLTIPWSQILYVTHVTT